MRNNGSLARATAELGRIDHDSELAARVGAAAQIAQTLIGHPGCPEQERNALLSRVFGPTDIRVLQTIVTTLGRAIERTQGQDGQRALSLARLAFLRSYATSAGTTTFLHTNVRLFSRTGALRRADELAFDDPRVADSHLLAQDDASALEPLSQSAPGSPKDEAAGSARTQPGDARLVDVATEHAIAHFFSEWEGTVSPVGLGLLLAFFSFMAERSESMLLRAGGRNAAFRRIFGALPRATRIEFFFAPAAEGLVHVRTVAGVERDLPARDAAAFESFLEVREFLPPPIPEDPSSFLVICSYLAGSTAQEPALLRSPCELDSCTARALLVEARKGRPASAYRDFFRDRGALVEKWLAPSLCVPGLRIIVTGLHLAMLDARRRSELLLRAVLALAKASRMGSGPEVSALWQQFTNVSQRDVDEIQRRLLRDVLGFLDGLQAPPGDESLRWVRDLKERARFADWQVEVGDKPGLEQEHLHTAIRHAMDDSGRARALLTPLRRRLIDAQYSPDAVLYELFQNADDAAIQGQEMNLREIDRFILAVEKGCVTVCYGGRQINRYSSTHFDAKDGVSRGYAEDLGKMVAIGRSEKQDFGCQVTGRFGYGFKSLHLITDGPLCMSGDLAFEIRGGVWPVRLDQTRCRTLENSARELTREKDVSDWTTIFAPLAVGVSESTVVARIRSCMQGTLAFSGRIKTFEIATRVGDDRLFERYAWREIEINGASHVRLGVCEKPGGESEQLLAFSNPSARVAGLSRNDALISINGSGPRPFPSEMPSLWVTVPTRETLDAGLMVNGMFAVDIGRTQIAREESRSEGAISSVCAALKQGFLELDTLSRTDEGWRSLAVNLGLEERVTREHFFRELWGILTKAPASGSAGSGILRRIVWGDLVSPGAATALYSEGHALPTGLWGEYGGTASIREVTHAVSGILAREAVFCKAIRLDGVVREYPPGSLVSEAEVAHRLKEVSLLGQLVERWKALRIQDVVEVALVASPDNSRTVPPSIASRLGDLLSSTSLEEWRRLDERETELLARFCRGLCFIARSGGTVPCGSLIPAISGLDDCGLTAFAPDAAVLSSEYQAKGIEFFALCLGGRQPDPSRIAVWASLVAPTNSAAVEGVLRFLLKGHGREDVARHLAQDREAVGRIVGCHVFQTWPIYERRIIEGLLRIDQTVPSDARPKPSEDKVRMELERIHDAWARGGDRSSSVSRWLYGSAAAEFSGLTAVNASDTSRRAWSIVLLRAALESLGRQSDGQKRAFVEICLERGLLPAGIEGPEEEPATLEFGNLRRFIDREGSEIEYLYFASRTMWLHIYSPWLSTYLDVMKRLPAGRLTIESIFNPRVNRWLGGGGPDAPPLKPALQRGAYHVLRELARLGILDWSRCPELCYAPGKALRDRLERLGLDFGSHQDDWSEIAYSFVERHLGRDRAHFNRCFDVPLRLWNPDTRDFSSLRGFA